MYLWHVIWDLVRLKYDNVILSSTRDHYDTFLRSDSVKVVNDYGIDSMGK